MDKKSEIQLVSIFFISGLFLVFGMVLLLQAQPVEAAYGGDIYEI